MNNNATIVFIDRTRRIAGEAKVTKEARDKAANMYIEKEHEQVSQIPDTAEEEEAVDTSQELDEVNDDPDEVLCGYCGEHWPFPDSKCHCGFTIKTSRCKIKCDRPDNLAKPWFEAFEEPDEANRDHIDNMDECIEGFVERDDIDRNLLAKTDVAEIAVDTADLDPDDIEAM